ncbi:MAG: hypothetical protein J5867_05360 [Prevotella sp.]|nr:hypothetical protein [Prevotella sp.]
MDNIVERVINFSEKPPTWPVCFQSECPLRSSCLRYVVGQAAPSTMRFGPAVYPQARQSDKCSEYRQLRVIHAAWGFSPLFHDVKHRHYKLLRDKMKEYLGNHTSYYRYHRGERLLTPEQQEWIIDLFASYGYTEDIHFEGYRDVIDFT